MLERAVRDDDSAATAVIAAGFRRAQTARSHVDSDHPEMERTDDELRERVAVDAYEVSTV